MTTRTFIAIPGKQGRFRIYTSVLTLRQLVEILPAPDASVPAEKRAQRSLQESRAHEIADYIGENTDYALPPITLSVSSLAFDGSALHVADNAVVYCNDGQHRRRAIEIAISEHPHLADDTVTVVFYEDADVASMQQRFADLNHAQPAARSVRLLYDLRNASKGREAAVKPPFAGLIEMQLSNTTSGSDKIWTLSGLDRTPNIDKTEFWTELFGSLPAGVDVKTLKRQYIWAHNVGLQGIGFVAEKVSVKDIEKIDWSRSNPEWEGRAQRGTKMLAARKNAILIANLVLKKFGLPLPPQFAKAEALLSVEKPVVSVPASVEITPIAQATRAPAIIQPKMKLDLGEWAKFQASGPFAYGDVPSFAGISGGRTSGMMAALLDPRVVMCFENTGREHIKTLEFVVHLQDALQREIVWLEWRPPKRKGAPPKEFGFEIVSFDTCIKRDPNNPNAGGVLFDGLLQALADHRATKGKGPVVPYHAQRTCTAYLKHRVQQTYMKSLGVGKEVDQIQYVGLRSDEPRRLADLHAAETSAKTYLTPLADAKITVEDVKSFWRRQSFDLELAHDYEGNCTACYLKDDAHLSRVLGDPETDAAWWIDVQKRYPGFGGQAKHSYEQLLHERPTRLMVESALREGVEPVDDGRLGERRFKLVVMNERRFLAGEMSKFSCACEASLVQSAKMDEEEESAA